MSQFSCLWASSFSPAQTCSIESTTTGSTQKINYGYGNFNCTIRIQRKPRTWWSCRLHWTRNFASTTWCHCPKNSPRRWRRRLHTHVGSCNWWYSTSAWSYRPHGASCTLLFWLSWQDNGQNCRTRNGCCCWIASCPTWCEKCQEVVLLAV